jgi:hypothetical protein
MIIDLYRRGGFTGIPVSIHLDTDSLTDSDQDQIPKIIQEIDFFNFKVPPILEKPAADRFTYNLKIVNGNEQNQVEFNEDSHISGLNTLVSLLMKHSRK